VFTARENSGAARLLSLISLNPVFTLRHCQDWWVSILPAPLVFFLGNLKIQSCPFLPPFLPFFFSETLFQPPTMRFTLSLLLFTSSVFALYPNPYGIPTGNITLCTDTSCQHNAYVNFWGLGGDFCRPLSSSSSSYGPPPVLNSYIINQRPTCDNGSYADWATYSDLACSKEKLRIPYNNDDTCESFAGVVAVAFICEGFGGGDDTTSTSILEPISISTIAIVTEPFPSNSIGTTTAQTYTFSTWTAASTTSAIVSSSTGVAQNGTATSATRSAPFAINTGGAASLFSRSKSLILAMPAWLLLVGL
jgi:hypothetical protein